MLLRREAKNQSSNSGDRKFSGRQVAICQNQNLQVIINFGIEVIDVQDMIVSIDTFINVLSKKKRVRRGD